MLKKVGLGLVAGVYATKGFLHKSSVLGRAGITSIHVTKDPLNTLLQAMVKVEGVSCAVWY